MRALERTGPGREHPAREPAVATAAWRQCYLAPSAARHPSCRHTSLGTRRPVAGVRVGGKLDFSLLKNFSLEILTHLKISGPGRGPNGNGLFQSFGSHIHVHYRQGLQLQLLKTPFLLLHKYTSVSIQENLMFSVKNTSSILWMILIRNQ